jgi:hypothetical protein
MQISIVIVEGAKQIMLTPETEHEKQALNFINPEDEISVVSKRGGFCDDFSHANLQVGMCQGDYLRAFNNADSLMFLIKDKKDKE